MQIRRVKRSKKETVSKTVDTETKKLSSVALAKLASKAIKTPEAITLEEVRQLGASVLSQRKPIR